MYWNIQQSFCYKFYAKFASETNFEIGNHSSGEDSQAYVKVRLFTVQSCLALKMTKLARDRMYDGADVYTGSITFDLPTDKLTPSANSDWLIS